MMALSHMLSEIRCEHQVFPGIQKPPCIVDIGVFYDIYQDDLFPTGQQRTTQCNCIWSEPTLHEQLSAEELGRKYASHGNCTF